MAVQKHSDTVSNSSSSEHVHCRAMPNNSIVTLAVARIVNPISQTASHWQ